MSWLVNGIAATVVPLVESGRVPESTIRAAIRTLVGHRLANLKKTWDPDPAAALAAFVRDVEVAPIAVETAASREQHYEVPTAFFELVLGPHRKYSSCFFPTGSESLGEAEAAALAITCQRAGIADGHRILELGCGWGSLTLWMAERFPAADITAVSHSKTQREYILDQAARRGIDANLTVITEDVNHFQPASRFNRIVSVEMFEHVRNHAQLLERIAGWLAPEGRLFVHIFCHRRHAYLFETGGAANWMGRHFFTGGMMPSLNLLEQYDRDLAVTRRWEWSGRHYALTANAWARNLDASRAAIIRLFESTYGRGEGRRWLMRWKIFFLACAELFGHADGQEWLVGHYLLDPVSAKIPEGTPMGATLEQNGIHARD
jgi:cyclopropane-fatty-acyl-phospholipid synthase